jgi:PAS domain S-box-containing protein
LFYGQRVRSIWYIAVIPVGIVLLALLTFAYPDIGLRIIVINAFSFAVLLEILELLTRQVPVELRTKSVSLLLNVIFILALNVFRVIALLIDPPKSQDFFNQSIFEKLFMILNMLSLLYLILNLAMLVSRRLLMEISAEEIKFNTIFNHAPYASMITHAVSGRVIGINSEMLKLLGFQTNDVIGVSVADLKIWIDPKDREHVINRLKAGESIDGQEQVFRHRDGSIVQTLFSAVLVRINQEDFIISTMKDIGEIIRLRTELKELASHDPMTKLPNRTQFKEYLTMQIAHCSRTGEKLAVIMFDVMILKILTIHTGMTLVIRF